MTTPSRVVPRQFRKRPVIIEAMQWMTVNDRQAVFDFVGGASVFRDSTLYIRTLEGDMRCERRDWIIRGYRKHLAAVFHRPEDITQADVLRYLTQCPRMSFRNEIGLLSTAFANWMIEGKLTFNPCFGVKSKRAGSKRKRVFTPAELDAIIGKADERLAVAIELAYATGLRIGDLCALRWADVAGIVETQKTGVRQRFAASEALEAILARARALQARVASRNVLCDRRGQAWLVGTLRNRWDAACEAADVADAHFHDLRATAATVIEKERGQEAARVFLGHKSIATTMTYLRDLRANVVTPLARKA